LCTLYDVTNEAIASTMFGLNEARGLWIVVEGLSELTNGNFEDGVADKSFWPDRVEKVFLGDQLARTTEEIIEHCEGFGSELDWL
jgi:hypothetical protein